jgi:hypothetical protein
MDGHLVDAFTSTQDGIILFVPWRISLLKAVQRNSGESFKP